MNAVPEEFSLRRCLLEPLRAQFGGGFALWTTALAFVVMHLPTWISSHATVSTYAAEVPEKLFFGLVAAWSSCAWTPWPSPWACMWAAISPASCWTA